MKFSRFLRGKFLFFLFALGTNQSSDGYTPEEPWPAGAKVVVQLGLGSPSFSLQDGFSSWNASAADALDIWRGYTDFITVSSVSAATAPETSGDGTNSAFFSNSVFGESFGEDTLAATVVLTGSGNGITEADVVVNTAFSFNSYRGPQQAGVYDFHRVMLHEFGHLLGLGHVTFSPPGQAIMEPIISDYDHLGPDDIAGIRSLYGARIDYLPDPVALRVGDPYPPTYYQPNNNPTSYSAFDLPPGLKLDAATGEVSGTATAAGDYGAVIIAHGPVSDSFGAFSITVLSLAEVPGLQAILPGYVFDLVADPVRPAIYTAGEAGLQAVDTETFAVTNLLSGDQTGSHLSVSADASTLIYTPIGGLLTEHRIDLDSLQPLADLSIPSADSAILEGLNNQAYVTSGIRQSGKPLVYQFDATTGVLQQSFDLGDPNLNFLSGTQLAISSDRKTLVVAVDSFAGQLASYDISGPDPIFIEKLSGAYSSPVISPDGQYVYYATGSAISRTAFQARLPDFSSPKPLITKVGIPRIAVGDNGLVYVVTYSQTGGDPISVFDPVTAKQISQIDVNAFKLDQYDHSPGKIVFDNSGKYLLFPVISATFEMWIVSTDFVSLPPPPSLPTKNLLNISTRVQVGAGQDAMIGGFIVQGSSPKKVLVRGLGPSLPITGAISDPTLELHDSTGKLVASNDNWKSDELNIRSSLLPPSSERESAIVMTLDPGAYTAVVGDKTGQPGLALVEVYDLGAKDSSAANISTRGHVGTGDNVMIGGFIIGGTEPARVVVRAIGPSLAALGIASPLADPVLEIHDSTGKLVFSNDDWRSTQESDLVAAGLAPANNSESAILATLAPGSYTAIVRGQGDASGVALVEVYDLDAGSTLAR